MQGMAVDTTTATAPQAQHTADAAVGIGGILRESDSYLESVGALATADRDSQAWRNREAGRALAAAAPDLLAALQQCVYHMKAQGYVPPCVTAADTAIAKAKGRVA